MKDIHTLWIGGELSLIERVCLASFAYWGHRVFLHCYGDVGAVPDGVECCDAREIVPENEIYAYPNGSYSAFSNLFRWEVLRQRGGIWVDTDVVCLRPFDFDSDYVFGWQDESTINGAVVGLPAECGIAKELARRCRNPNQIHAEDSFGVRLRKLRRRYLQGDKRGNIKWGEGGGVYAFSNYIRSQGLSEMAKPFFMFYPVQPACWMSLMEPGLKVDSPFFSESYAVHLWNERYRSRGICKDGPFPEGSFIHSCMERFLAA